MNYPKVIVFDLDFTLWNGGGTWCDHLRAPFARRRDKLRKLLEAEAVKVFE